MAQTAKREALNVRIQPQLRALIDRAAQLAGKTRTDFVLEAAKRAAEDALKKKGTDALKHLLDNRKP